MINIIVILLFVVAVATLPVLVVIWLRLCALQRSQFAQLVELQALLPVPEFDRQGRQMPHSRLLSKTDVERQVRVVATAHPNETRFSDHSGHSERRLS